MCLACLWLRAHSSATTSGGGGQPPGVGGRGSAEAELWDHVEIGVQEREACCSSCLSWRGSLVEGFQWKSCCSVEGF